MKALHTAGLIWVVLASIMLSEAQGSFESNSFAPVFPLSGYAVFLRSENQIPPSVSHSYAFFLSASFGPEFQSFGVGGFRSSSGTYSYALTNPVGTVRYVSPAGDATNTLSFNSVTSGSFVFSDGSSQQTGFFDVATSPTSYSIGDQSFRLNIIDGSAPFAASGTAVLTFASSTNTYTIVGLEGSVTNSSGNYSYFLANAATSGVTTSNSASGISTTYFAFQSPASGFFLTTQPSSGAFEVGTFTISPSVPAPFFDGQVDLGNGVNYLQLSNGNAFGYYNLVSFGFPWFYHNDLGFEYFFNADNAARGCYLYDSSSDTFFYTDPADFPFLYDFKLSSWLYYFPDTERPGHYTSNPRVFYNFGNGQVITK